MFHDKKIYKFIKKEINDAKKRLIGLKFKLEKLQSPKTAKQIETVISRLEQSIAKKEKQYARIKPGRISDEWCM